MTHDYQNRKYTVVSYDPNWAMQFETEKNQLNSIFKNDALDIIHIGSTAIPGMAGKPAIDILILVKEIKNLDKYIDQVEKLGYTYKGEYIKKESRLFHKEKDGSVIGNLHIFPIDHPHVKDMLKVKDYLINHPDIAKEYSNLKIELYDKYPNDYSSYRKYKDEWMNNLKNNL